MQISGKNLHGKLGSALIAGITDLDLSEDGDNLDATTGADAGGLRDDTGCGRLTAEIKGYFSTANGTVCAVRRGDAVTNLNLYISADESGGPKATITAGLVQRFRITGQVRDRVYWNTTVVSQGSGSYTLPSAS